MANHKIFSVKVTGKTPSGQIVTRTETSIKASTDSDARRQAKARASTSWLGKNKIIDAVVTFWRDL